MWEEMEDEECIVGKEAGSDMAKRSNCSLASDKCKRVAVHCPLASICLRGETFVVGEVTRVNHLRTI
jgi:hypothetical protein